MAKVNCLFCLARLDDPVVYEKDIYKKIFSDYTCQTCQSDMTFLDDERCIEYSLESGDYRVLVNLDNNTCLVQHWRQIPTSKAMLQYLAGWITLVRLNHIPQNLNPKTVAGKIKTILVFS